MFIMDIEMYLVLEILNKMKNNESVTDDEKNFVIEMKKNKRSSIF